MMLIGQQYGELCYQQAKIQFSIRSLLVCVTHTHTHTHTHSLSCLYKRRLDYLLFLTLKSSEKDQHSFNKSTIKTDPLLSSEILKVTLCFKGGLPKTCRAEIKLALAQGNSQQQVNVDLFYAQQNMLRSGQEQVIGRFILRQQCS